MPGSMASTLGNFEQRYVKSDSNTWLGQMLGHCPFLYPISVGPIAVALQNGLSDYDTIRCINFIRAEVAEGRSPLQALLKGKANTARPWENDQYMRPVIPEDPLLFYDFDEDMNEEPHR